MEEKKKGVIITHKASSAKIEIQFHVSDLPWVHISQRGKEKAFFDLIWFLESRKPDEATFDSSICRLILQLKMPLMREVQI